MAGELLRHIPRSRMAGCMDEEWEEGIQTLSQYGEYSSPVYGDVDGEWDEDGAEKGVV